MNCVKISSLSFHYGEHQALSEINLDVAEGELFGIIGPDSAGKTTLLRTICTLLPVQSGEVEVLGMPSLRKQKEIRAAIGYMPQRFSLYQDLSVEQNLRFFARLFGVKGADFEKRITELNRFSRLEPFASRKAGALSGGMKQKLALSCALIHTPRLLVLDEPTFGVDPVSRIELWNILHELNAKGSSIVVSTPYMDEANQCARVALLHKGKILKCDKPQDLISRAGMNLYRIAGTPLTAIRTFLQSRDGIRDIQLFGSEIHLLSEHPISQDTIARWRAECPGIAECAAIAPTMEDVFLQQMLR